MTSFGLFDVFWFVTGLASEMKRSCGRERVEVRGGRHQRC